MIKIYLLVKAADRFIEYLKFLCNLSQGTRNGGYKKCFLIISGSKYIESHNLQSMRNAKIQEQFAYVRSLQLVYSISHTESL